MRNKTKKKETFQNPKMLTSCHFYKIVLSQINLPVVHENICFIHGIPRTKNKNRIANSEKVMKQCLEKWKIMNNLNLKNVFQTIFDRSNNSLVRIVNKSEREFLEKELNFFEGKKGLNVYLLLRNVFHSFVEEKLLFSFR